MAKAPWFRPPPLDTRIKAFIKVHMHQRCFLCICQSLRQALTLEERAESFKEEAEQLRNKSGLLKATADAHQQEANTVSVFSEAGTIVLDDCCLRLRGGWSLLHN